MTIVISRFLILCPLLGLAGDAPSDPVVGPIAPLIEAPASEMARVVDRWAADREAVAKRYPIADSPARRDRLRKFAKAWRGRLDEVEFETLSLEGKVDALLLDNALKADLARLDREERRSREMAPLLPFAATLTDLVEARRRLDPVHPEEAADALDRVRVRLVEVRKSLDPKAKDAPRVSRSVAWRAAGAVEDLRAELERWFRFYDGYDPLFSWWVRDPYRRVEESLRDHAKFLRETLAGIKADDEAIPGDPIGREGLLEDLRAEMIPYTPEELIAIGEREFAWCEAELKKAAREMGFGDDAKAALEAVKKKHVAPGQQPILVRDLARESIAFLKTHDLITLPPLAEEDWPIEMISPRGQKVNPFFTGGAGINVPFPTDAMEHAEKRMSLRGNNIHFVRAVVAHELIPGHHLQYFSRNRRNTHRDPFDTPFWTEGWALYWEMLLWDKHFARGPEDRVGMLFWRRHRAARILFSLKFHLGQMTAPEAIDFLVDRVGHERANAAGEVRRSFVGNYPPLYQAAYMLGGLQLRALRDDLVTPGKMTEKAFHDRVLAAGCMPIEMVRVLLTGSLVTRDFVPKWRFAGPGPRDN